MNNEYYILHLYEPACPAFCSFDKLYVGSKAEILMVADNLEKSSDYENTAKAIRSYFSGDKSAMHNVAYHNQKILVPITVDAEYEHTFSNKEWTHTNIWGFPYNMKCDSGKAHQIVFTYNSRVYRCVRAWFKNLCYESISGAWNMLDGGFWGNAAIIDIIRTDGQSDFTFNNLLYVEEEVYDEGSTTATDDIRFEEKIEFQKICDEIFADG